MLSCLCHNTIGSSYYKDSSIHLCSTGDHVLNIVSVARAVNVSIVSLFCLVLNVSGVDGDSSFSLFRSFIDISKISCCVTSYTISKNLGNSSCKSCLTVVNVSDSSDVTVWFGSLKMRFCHFNTLLINVIQQKSCQAPTHA